MKTDTHPEYYEKAKIVCACGETYETGSTEDKLTVELCAKCHPFYTGKQKIVDSARRVERFEKLMKKHEEASQDKKKEDDDATQEEEEKDTPEDKKKKTVEDLKKMKKELDQSSDK